MLQNQTNFNWKENKLLRIQILNCADVKMIIENIGQTWSFSYKESDLVLEKWESGNFELFPHWCFEPDMHHDNRYPRDVLTRLCRTSSSLKLSINRMLQRNIKKLETEQRRQLFWSQRIFFINTGDKRALKESIRYIRRSLGISTKNLPVNVFYYITETSFSRKFLSSCTWEKYASQRPEWSLYSK